VSPKSSSTATSQKNAHPAVVVSPMRNGPKNRTRQIAKSASVEAKPSAAVSSKRSRQDELSANQSAKRRNSIAHAAKSATAKSPMSLAATKKQNSEAAKNAKDEAAVTPHVEHAAKLEAAKESKPEVAVAKKEHRAPAVSAKNIATKPGLDSAENGATGTSKTPKAPNSKPSEKTPTPAVAAATPKNAPESLSGPVAKLVPPAVPNAMAATSQKPATPAANALPKSTAPEDSPPPAPKPAAAAAPNAPAPNPILSGDFVLVPSKPGRPQRVTFPQKQIANSSSLAISSQLSVVVPAASGTADQPSRLQGGKLVSYVLPHDPRPGNHYGAEETVKVQATVGRQGFVIDIKPVSGPIFLLSSTMSAVRSWRYKPALVNGTPVETHQDVTVTFNLAR
jgi:protein TonB